MNQSQHDIRLTLRLRIELARQFGLFAIRGVRMVKPGKDSIVLQGWYRGEPVFFKKYLGPTSAQMVRQASAEMDFLETNLKQPFFANKCLAAAPDIGTVILGQVPGHTVRHVLTKAAPSERPEILQSVGGWLRCCADLRSQDMPLRAQWYFNRLQAISTDNLTSGDRLLIVKMLAELRRLAGSLKDIRVPHAIAHTDLTLQNAYYSAGEVHVIDINDTRWLPTSRIAARFLVMKDLFYPSSQPEMLHGLDASEAKLFLSAAGAEDPNGRIVRFFVGEQIIRIFVGGTQQFNPKANANARETMTAFLSDPWDGETDGIPTKPKAH